MSKQTLGPGRNDPVDGLTNDVLWLLIATFVYRSRSQLEGVANWSARHLSEELLLLEVAQRDLVLRLTALDDEGRGQRSFRSVANKLKKEGALSGEKQVSVDKALKTHRTLINPMKVQHRNAYIGHVLEEQSSTPRLPQGPDKLDEAIASATALTDLLSGSRQGYTFKLFSSERIDLRATLGV